MIKQTHLITPWSIFYVQEYLYRNVCTVVFGCKNCKLIAFSPENSGWAEQLSIIITTFITCIPNLRSSSCKHSSKNVPSIHLLRSISAREVTNVLEASWTDRFSNHKHWDFFTQGFRRIQPCSLHFALFSTWITLTSEV